MDNKTELYAIEGHGAIEVESPTSTPLMIVLAGPIRVWWSEWDSQRHQDYTVWRDAVRVALVHAGHLVYSPHRAWQGAWSDVAQSVNDAAVKAADALIVLTPPGVPAVGTSGEMEVARAAQVPIIEVPPGHDSDLDDLLVTLEALLHHRVGAV